MYRFSLGFYGGKGGADHDDDDDAVMMIMMMTMTQWWWWWCWWWSWLWWWWADDWWRWRWGRWRLRWGWWRRRMRRGREWRIWRWRPCRRWHDDDDDADAGGKHINWKYVTNYCNGAVWMYLRVSFQEIIMEMQRGSFFFFYKKG